MKKAMFYQSERELAVRCGLCSHHCKIKDKRRGLCGVRENRGGKLVSLVYGKVISEHVDPVEKKPLFHLLPGSLSYSISTVGCNFFCRHCQNYQISQYPHDHKDIIGQERSPAAIVDAAEQAGCASISYTYVEPTVFYEFAYDCCVLAREKNIKNIFVSNGYMTEEVARHLAPVLDGINIDIKAFTEKFYRQVCKAKLKPVLDTVRLMHELGVWVEVTTLIIPGWNDTRDELRSIARFIKDIDPAMPWHVSAFYPTYKMLDRPPTPVARLRMARDIGIEEGLRFVYVGNVPGENGENTFCPACNLELINRYGYRTRLENLAHGSCSACGEKIAGVWQ
jgi:pyruvate formate lyase activating enzyme